MIDKELVVVITLCFGFLFWQTSYDTVLSVQEYIFRSVQSEDPSFTIVGYYATSCHFVASAIISIFTPTITNKLGPRITIIISGIGQLLFNIQFLYLNEYLIYMGNVIRATSNSFAWTAQGRYLSQNSQKDTIIRNSGLFGLFIHFDRIIGNIYILVRFRSEHFNYLHRMEFYGIMSGTALVALIIFLCLPIALYNQPVRIDLKNSLLSTFHHFIDRDNLALLVLYFYHGMQYSFFAGIYSNCLGFTLSLPDTPMVRMAYSGLFTGIGGILTGIILGSVGKKINRRGFVLIGVFLMQAVNLVLVLLNLPHSCLTSKTNDSAIITSNIYLAFVNSFLLGVTDVIEFTMLYSLFLFIFKSKIAEAHATFRIASYFAVAVQFGFTPLFGLYGIIALHLTIFSLAVISFCLIERKHILIHRKEEEEMNNLELQENLTTNKLT